MQLITKIFIFAPILMISLIMGCEDPPPLESCEDVSGKLYECGITSGPSTLLEACEESGASDDWKCYRECDVDMQCDEYSCCQDECNGQGC